MAQVMDRVMTGDLDNDAAAAYLALTAMMDRLEHRLDALEEWLEDVAGDMLDRTERRP